MRSGAIYCNQITERIITMLSTIVSVINSELAVAEMIAAEAGRINVECCNCPSARNPKVQKVTDQVRAPDFCDSPEFISDNVNSEESLFTLNKPRGNTQPNH